MKKLTLMIAGLMLAGVTFAAPCDKDKKACCKDKGKKEAKACCKKDAEGKEKKACCKKGGESTAKK